MLPSRLCLRAAARPLSTPIATTIGLRPSQQWPKRRVFASTPRHRKDNARIPVVANEAQAKQPADESVKPESVKKELAAQPLTNNTLLAEADVSKKQQRQADWRIIKDMSQYLWPKDDMGVRFRVGISVALLVGAKVRKTYTHPPITYRRIHVDRWCNNVGPQRSGSFLFQDHRRFLERRLHDARWYCCHCCRCIHIRVRCNANWRHSVPGTT